MRCRRLAPRSSLCRGARYQRATERRGGRHRPGGTRAYSSIRAMLSMCSWGRDEVDRDADADGATTDAIRARDSTKSLHGVDDDCTSSSSASNGALTLSLPRSRSFFKRPRPSVAAISPSSLFNRLQTASLVVVDCRSAADFAAGHIRGALLCEHGRRSRHRTVDDVLKDACDPSSECARKLDSRDMMEVVVIGSNRSSASLLTRMDGGYRFAKLLLKEGRVFSVVFLAAGFQAFAQTYPFMLQRGLQASSSSVSTSSSSVSTSSLSSEDPASPCVQEASLPSPVTQYPNEIVDGFLFLGNFWQANNAQVVADLGITHIVNMGAITDDRNRFQGVQYLDVEIKDHENVDIRKEFAHTIAFIQDATKQTGARVLIHCVQGVSRSSTIVIWYLMVDTKCTLSAAYSYVLKRRPLIFPNRGFMEQLMENEKQLYGFESVLPQELDLLQHGLLPPLDRKGSALRMSLSS